MVISPAGIANFPFVTAISVSPCFTTYFTKLYSLSSLFVSVISSPTLALDLFAVTFPPVAWFTVILYVFFKYTAVTLTFPAGIINFPFVTVIALFPCFTTYVTKVYPFSTLVVKTISSPTVALCLLTLISPPCSCVITIS